MKRWVIAVLFVCHACSRRGEESEEQRLKRRVERLERVALEHHRTILALEQHREGWDENVRALNERVQRAEGRLQVAERHLGALHDASLRPICEQRLVEVQPCMQGTRINRTCMLQHKIPRACLRLDPARYRVLGARYDSWDPVYLEYPPSPPTQ